MPGHFPGEVLHPLPIPVFTMLRFGTLSKCSFGFLWWLSVSVVTIYGSKMEVQYLWCSFRGPDQKLLIGFPL